MRFSIKQLLEDLCLWLSIIVADGNSIPPRILNWGSKDWEIAQSIVFMQGMGPVWGKLCQAGWYSEHMPEKFREYLLLEYKQNTLRIEKIHKTYGEINQRMTRRKIPFFSFKGIDLAKRIYPDSGMRPMADIDIYVGENHKRAVLDLFENAGYLASMLNSSGATFFPANWIKNKTKESSNLHHNMNHKEKIYQGECPQSPFSIDVHFNMRTQFILKLFDQTDVFEHTLTESDKGLSTEDYYIYLLLHAAKHLLTRCGRWLNLYDLYLFQEKHQLDSELLLEKIAKTQISHLILIPLVLCRQVLNGPISILEKSLWDKIGLKHRMLLRRINLSEMSCCNPWEATHYSLLVWSKSFRDILDWFYGARKRKQHYMFREATELKFVPSMSARMVSRIKRLVIRKARSRWSILASHGLNPKLNWK